MSSTIDYYNRNADSYYWATVALDVDALRKQFASYLPSEASVVDMGCGSGRDVLAFKDMGFNAVGIDAAKDLVELAVERLEIKVEVADISSWRASAPFDGVWCCASLIHLKDEEKEKFFKNLNYNLKKGGVIYISVKDGIETGTDKDGRYYSNCSESELRKHLEDAGCEILDVKTTEDSMGRSGFKWLNVFARKTK